MNSSPGPATTQAVIPGTSDTPPRLAGSHVLVIGDSISLAHVGRAIVAARLLTSADCKVTFATGPAHQALARQEGLEPREIHCEPPARAIAAIRRGSHIFDLETVERYVAADLALIENVAPDWIVADFRLSLNISCELARIPYWNIVNGYMTHYYSAPQRPPQTFPVTRLLGKRLSQRFFPALKRQVLRYYAYNFNRSRKRHGLKPGGDMFRIMESPHGNLIADLPEFIPCDNLPSHFRYIGPLIWEPNVPEPEWLDRLDPSRPSVYITMGSTGEGGMFREAVSASVQAGYQVLTTTAGQVDELPPEVFAVKYAPGSVLARRSVATVCHGGSLTIYQSLAEAVPVVAIPTFHDQETNAERLRATGLGLALSPRGWTAADLLAAVDRVQGSDFRQRCGSARAQIREFQSQQSQNILSLA
jgi:UDP:flavonoid glycosyltransferase YjiC (YdhE family)